MSTQRLVNVETINRVIDQLKEALQVAGVRAESDNECLVWVDDKTLQQITKDLSSTIDDGNAAHDKGGA